MRLKIFILILYAFNCTFCYSQVNTIELPINSKNGFGPFTPHLFGLKPYSTADNNPWQKTYLKITGLPVDWKNVKKGQIETNNYQTVYQNYFSGKITQQWYESIQNGWGWIPDPTSLSKTPLKSVIAYAYEVDVNGEVKMIIDANNNHDFSDDIIFTPTDYNIITSTSIDAIVENKSIIVTYERLLKNEIIQDESRLFISYYKKANMFFYNFPKYSTTTFKGTEIAVCSDEFGSPSFNKTTIALLSDIVGTDEMSLTEINEFININDNLYLNKGVNPNKNVLVLENKENNQSQLESTKVGFKTISFKGEDFKTKRTIKSDDYKGKYLLIDFWGTWCKPCVKELPNLKHLYNNIDKSKFEIISIVVKSPTNTLHEMIEKYSITWPQIISNNKNKINDSYGVDSYPTTYLVDPTGIIIAKNLRGKELNNKIQELLN
jgi:thiol-disulfide isomerase/thioredoxin